MISIFLFFLTKFISGIVVRIGAIALELTGMPEEQASFQALSAFSGVGFTTGESEFLVSHPERRKIIKNLISGGSGSIAATLGTLSGIIFQSGSIVTNLSEPPMFPWLPLNRMQLLLACIVGITFLTYKATRSPAFSRLMKEVVAAGLLKGQMVVPASYEEVLINSGGWGIFQIEVTENNPMAGKRLQELSLRDKKIEVLFVVRKGEAINKLEPTFRFDVGDTVTVFGPITMIHDHCTDLKMLGRMKQERKKSGKDEMLALDSKAPEFSLPSSSGETVRLSDFQKKKNVVLIFYPKDKSFFCSLQLKGFSEALGDIRDLDAEVFGINAESPRSHQVFCSRGEIRFPLLSDPTRKTCRGYRAVMLGGLVVDRTVYVIDKNGKVRFAKRGRPPVYEIVSVLKEIQQPLDVPPAAGGVFAKY